MPDGSDLTAAGEQKPFGRIYADGSSAWVEFLAKEGGTDTVLSGYDGLNNADFYLDCQRAGAVPLGETPIEGNSNLYAMKFENSTQLAFGYDENEPVTAKAQIDKRGLQNNKTITWTISYTPWQNPSESDPVGLNTPFELRDTIDTSLHTFVEGSVRIDGELVTTTTTRDPGVKTYVIVEPSPDGSSTALTFGGTKFNAGAATKGNPAKPLNITYDTSIQDHLLLPGGKDGKVTNAVELFAGKDGVFDKLNISGSSAVDISQPAWLEKTGTTTRHTDGTGSTTDWTVTFKANGFTGFTELTLHDQLPTGSTLDMNSVKVDGTFATAVEGEGNSFTVSGIAAKAPDKDVVITYQTSVPETMYENGTNLGSNAAWFTFRYGGQDYTTPQAKKDVGSGDGTGTPGTARLVKTNGVYNAADRTIKWTIKINPHKANLKSGTFIDDLSALGPACNVSGYPRGLEVAGDIAVLVGDSAPADENKVKVTYSNQKITVAIKDVGYQTITLAYTTKVCDPCVFANNTTNAQFKNAISTDDMVIGNSTAGCSASADSTATVSATVLTKQAPVY